MPLSSSNKVRILLCAAIALLSLCVIGTANAEFSVEDVRAKIKNERLTVSFDMDLNLSDQAEEALDRGIPLIFKIRMNFGRNRRLMWNEKIQQWSRDIELRFHALSERYIVQETGRGDIDSFVTIADAMTEIGKGRTITIPVAGLPTNPGITYEIEVRAALDIEALPTPLRLMAYLSPGWRLSTGSKKWPVLQ